MKILVVDDVKNEQEGAVDQLGSRHELTVVDNYHAGMNAIHSQEWDAVLTDMMMPSREGLQPYGFVLAAMAQARGIPVAIVSAGNHHDHPMLFAAEDIGGKVSEKFFVLAAEYCPRTEGGKNWAEALKVLSGQAEAVPHRATGSCGTM